MYLLSHLIFSLWLNASSMTLNYDEAQMVINGESATTDCDCYQGLDSDPAAFIQTLRSGDVYGRDLNENQSTQ